MEQLEIKYELIGGKKIQAVNARDLWNALGSNRQFSNWIKDKLKSSQAVEGQDFIIFAQVGENSGRGRPEKEYFISLDMAKHFCMLERNEKGRKIRQYFIDVEEKARKLIPKNPEELISLVLIEAHKIIERLKQETEEQKIEIQEKEKTIRWLQCKKNVRVLETKIQEAPRRVLEHFCLADYKEAYNLIYREFKKYRGYDIRKLWQKMRKSEKETFTQFLIRTGKQNEYLQVIEALLTVNNTKELQIENQIVIWELEK